MTILLQDLVARQAALRPSATSLVWKDERVSYGDLEARSNRLARRLRRAGVRPGERVCFLAPKSPLPLLWMLGILKAGAIHVPLDPASPAARLQKIIDACEPRLVLTPDASFTDGDSDAPLEPGTRPQDPAQRCSPRARSELGLRSVKDRRGRRPPRPGPARGAGRAR